MLGRVVRGNKRYLLVATTVFFVGILVGAAFCFFSSESEVEEVIRLLGEMQEEFTRSSAADLIFKNLRVATLSWLFFLNLFTEPNIALKLLFSIPFVGTLFFAFGNGFLIGFIGALVTLMLPNGVFIVLAGILPHGIFEAPAFVFSLSAGLKLSWTIVKTIKNRDVTILFQGFKQSFLLFLPTIPLMIVAGLIEWYITPIIIDLVI